MRNDWLETIIKATEELLFLLYKQRESKLQQRLIHRGCRAVGHLVVVPHQLAAFARQEAPVGMRSPDPA